MLNIKRGMIEMRAVAQLNRAGMIGGTSPRDAAATLKAIKRLGQLGAAAPIAAIKYPNRTGLIDELGSLTFTELNQRSDALTCVLRDRGIGEQDCIGILCRNHRGFLDITFAAAKLGARVLYLNTDFGGPQLRDVCTREDVSLLVHDEEYCPVTGPIETKHGSMLGWTDADSASETLGQLIAAGAGRIPNPPSQHARVVLLTSGTTGAPRGAPLSSSRSLAPVGALLSKVPYRSGESTYIAPPMFHGVGYTQVILSVSLGCSSIIRRHFNADAALDGIHQHRPTALVLVPVMLRRIVTLLEENPGKWDTSSLRLVFVSGSQLEAELVGRAQRTIGDKLYNYYGSTEAGYATYATPEDLRAAPGCAGRAPFDVTVRLYDDAGRQVKEPGRVGRIFVANSSQIDSYTDGGTKEVIDGLMSTGDVGHFDAAGRLFIDGRDDDMIVSGGENVFPGEVEELLITPPTSKRRR